MMLKSFLAVDSEMSLVLECFPIIGPQQQVLLGQASSLGGILKTL